jgi:hypothetical protein
MTDTIISLNIDLFFWITVQIKQLVTSGRQPNSAVLVCVLAVDRNVSDRKKPTPLQHNSSLNSFQNWSHASLRPHFLTALRHTCGSKAMPVVCCQTTDKTPLSLRTEDRLIPFSLQLLLSASFFLSYPFILFLPSPIGIYFCGPFYNTFSIAQYVILTF